MFLPWSLGILYITSDIHYHSLGVSTRKAIQFTYNTDNYLCFVYCIRIVICPYNVHARISAQDQVFSILQLYRQVCSDGQAPLTVTLFSWQHVQTFPFNFLSNNEETSITLSMNSVMYIYHYWLSKLVNTATIYSRHKTKSTVLISLICSIFHVLI